MIFNNILTPLRTYLSGVFIFYTPNISDLNLNSIQRILNGILSNYRWESTKNLIFKYLYYHYNMKLQFTEEL